LADNTFRSLRGRQVPALERSGAPARDANDPLAELARLIGQSDPYAERQSEARERRPVADDVASSGREWVEEDEVEQAYATEARYAAPPAMPRATPLRQYAPKSEEPDYEHEPPADDQYFSGPSGNSGYQDGADTEDPRQDRQAAAGRPVPTFLTTPQHEESAEFAEPEHDAGDDYASEEYYQPSQQRRRGGLVLVMAVLGLAVVGTAGAFAYRATFGGSLLPALPPVIKANNSPNKVMPNSGDTQVANSGQGGAASISAAENVVSREEEPINIDPPKPAPRIISTIPVTNNQSAALPPSVVASVAPMPGSAGAPSTGPDWPSSPAIAAPVATAPAQANPPVNAAATPPGPPAEPKKIRTVTIRPDQAGAADASGARTTARGAAARASAPDGNAPLALVPGGGDAAAAAPPRSRRSPPSTAVASATTASTAPNETSSAAGYAVQVSSQHSETEAQSSFQALRAKYPDVLGKREPIIRRVDLGAKGIYYRALVGPFASADEAAAMCSSLKAAGGNCIPQKN
jgi:SPOR domain